MKAFGMVLVVMLALLTLSFSVGAVNIGSGVNINMNTEEFKPMIWMCDGRAVLDDDIEPGRVDGDAVYSLKVETCECVYEQCYTSCTQGAASFDFQCTGLAQRCQGTFEIQSPLQCRSFCLELTNKYSCPILKGYELGERHNNYAFEGEKIEWLLLAMDKNKVEQIEDVYVTIGPKRSGRLEDFCDLPAKNIVIDGNVTESAWGSSDFEIDATPGKCDYKVYLENDCNNLYVGFKVVNISCNPDISIVYMNLSVNGAEVNILKLASSFMVKLPSAEFKIPLSALNLRTGDTMQFAFKMFSVCERQPQVGYLSHKLAAKWVKRPVYNGVEVECVELHGFAAPGENIKSSCNARIGEEVLDQFDPQTMAYYECTFTVEPASSMYGEYFVVPEVEDSTGMKTVNDENEYWFFNPEIALSVDGTLDFGIVRPGTIAYSETLLVGNDADDKSGVLLDMFVSGTDFYDPASTGSRCVISNRLKLGNNYAVSSNNGATGVSPNKCDIGFKDGDDHFCYFATSGGYGTNRDPRRDAEGYVPVVYGNAFSRDFYNDAEIIQADRMGAYWGANILAPGAETALTFKLGLPLPCTGDFTDGQIYFWGEAI